MRRAVNVLALPIGAALLLALATGRAARAADDTPEAEALIRQGIQLRVKGDAPHALPLFEKAYRVSRSPRTAAQLGLVELELGSCVEAERYLTEALAVPDHPWIAKNKGTLKKQLEAARKDIGELVVTGAPAGAEIWVNHKVVGKLPLAAPIRLDKGHVDIEVRAANYATAADATTIAAQKQVQRNYVLAPEPPTPRAPEPAVAVATNAAPEAASGGPAETLKTAPPPAKGGSVVRPLFWVSAGAAVVALAFGAAEGINAAAKRNDFNNHTTTVGGVTYQDCGTAALSSACQPLKQAYDQAFTLSVVGFVAAGALAAGASTLFILSHGERAGAPDAGASTHAFGCVPDPVSRGLTCNLRF
jgi:tetratricopeptide (TPR) repeat protein